MNENVTESNCTTCCDCCVHFPNETTPLISRQRSNANCCVVFLLFLTLCLGVAIGTYLLIEDTEWESDQPIPLMTTASISKLNTTAQDHIINEIKLVEIPGPPCQNDVECTEQISRDSTTNAKSDLINFLIDSNATIYEHKGYDNHCLNCDSNSLVIALSSMNATSMSSRDQTYKIEEIIDYGVNRTAIEPCSAISTDENVRRLREIADEIQSVINRKYKCLTHK